MNEWISVKDRLPCLNDYVLVLTNENEVLVAYYLGERAGYQNRNPYAPWRDGLVSYWMPLPEPPRVEQKGPFRAVNRNGIDHLKFDGDDDVIVIKNVPPKCLVRWLNRMLNR